MAKHRRGHSRCRVPVLVLEVLALLTAVVTLVDAVLRLL